MSIQKPFEFTDQNFQSEVLESDKPVLVDFWASWCGPCRMLTPVVEQLAQQYGDSVKVGKVNIDEHQETPEKFGITSIPSVLIFHNGAVVETLVGVQPRWRYEQALEQLAVTA